MVDIELYSWYYKKAIYCGQLAQSVEQRTENPRVPGSIPGLATIKKKMQFYIVSSFFYYIKKNYGRIEI